MPYSLRKSDSKVKVVNTSTGHVKGTHSSRAKAQRQINLLRGIEYGWTPTGKLHSPTGRSEKDWVEPWG